MDVNMSRTAREAESRSVAPAGAAPMTLLSCFTSVVNSGFFGCYHTRIFVIPSEARDLLSLRRKNR
jgi:hypothetical protein